MTENPNTSGHLRAPMTATPAIAEPYRAPTAAEKAAVADIARQTIERLTATADRMRAERKAAGSTMTGSPDPQAPLAPAVP